MGRETTVVGLPELNGGWKGIRLGLLLEFGSMSLKERTREDEVSNGAAVSDRAFLGFYCEPDVKEALLRLATRNERNASQELRLIVRTVLAAESANGAATN